MADTPNDPPQPPSGSAGSDAAAEVRKLRLLIAGIVVVVLVVGVGWWAFGRASDSGKTKADDRIACVRENLTSPTTRDC